MAERNIHTLQSMKSSQGDKVIANYGRSIVFLPDNTPENKNVRVELFEIRLDRRGYMMYRAVPAPSVSIERTRDNGDGTMSRVTMLIDWLGNESEMGVIETRTFRTREGTPTTRSNYRIVWSDMLATSMAEDHQIEVIPIEEEYVFDSTLHWKKKSERTVPRPVFSFPITEVRVNNSNFWWMARHEVAWKPELAVLGEVLFQTSSGQILRNALTTTFSDMPDWWKKEQEVKFPVSSCKRQRRDVITFDGYTKCETCRKEEICDRCSQKKSVQLIEGKLICSTCKPLEEMDREMEEYFPLEGRIAIAEQAKQLVLGTAIPNEAGVVILQATMDHIASGWRRDDFLAGWKSYHWYYFCEDGVYGTKLAPEALQILEYLPQATGDGLIEMACWIAQGPGTFRNVSDYYITTQVEGNTFDPSDFNNRTGKSLGNLLEQVGEGAINDKIVLATRLRGSEADRIAAVEGYRRMVEYLGKDERRIRSIAEILEAEEQDYARAAAIVRAIDEELAERASAIASGAIWPDVQIDISTQSRAYTDVFAIGSNGLIIDPVDERRSGRRDRYVSGYRYGDLPNSVLVVEHSHDNYGYQSTERWQVHYLPARLTDAQRTTLKRVEEETRHYFTGPGTGWDLRNAGTVQYTTAYSRDFVGREAELDAEMHCALPIDVTKWEQLKEGDMIVVGPYPRRGKETKTATRKRAEDEARRTVAEKSQTLYSTEEGALNPLAEKLKAALGKR